MNMNENLESVAAVRDWADRIKATLPEAVDAAALGVKSKAPFQLLCTREALIWRTEELARNGCNALERDDFAVAAILTRAITESAALAWKLMNVLEARKQHSSQQLNDLLMRMLVGSKQWEDMPNPFHVLTLLEKLTGYSRCHG